MKNKFREYLHKGLDKYLDFIELLPNSEWRKKNHDLWVKEVSTAFDSVAIANDFCHKINLLLIGIDRNQSIVRQWKDNLDYSSVKCTYCFKILTKKTVHADHKVPIHKGGSDDFQNLQPTCSKCNAGKSDRLENQLHNCWYSSEIFNQLNMGKKTISTAQRFDILLLHNSSCNNCENSRKTEIYPTWVKNFEDGGQAFINNIGLNCLDCIKKFSINIVETK